MMRDQFVWMGVWSVLALLTMGCAGHHEATDQAEAVHDATPKSPAVCSGFYVEQEADPMMQVYFGSYTQDRPAGIYHFEFDPNDGSLTRRGDYGGVVNPSFLAIHPDGKTLYSVSEAGDRDGLAAFRIGENGGLELINKQTADAREACHVIVDPAGTTAIASLYGSGSVASFPLASDGELGPVASLIHHEGSSVNPHRQEQPHAHSVNIDASGRFAVAADLGTDQLLVYRLDAQTSELTPNDPSAFDLHPGAGPRHFAFHPNGKFAYVINELDATMTAMAWDAEAGTLTFLQKIDTLPADFDGRKSTAEVVVHSSGKFLYGSNRGHESIVIYAIDPNTGLLTLVGHENTRGQEPRNFNLDPTGRWLIACNQNTHDAQVFSVDQDSGKLTAVGEPIAVPMPVCVKFLAR